MGKIGGHCTSFLPFDKKKPGKFHLVPRVWTKPLSNDSPPEDEHNHQSVPSPETPLIPTECTEVQSENPKKESSISDSPVTVYWNYIGDNSGMLLNCQRFHSSMPTIFGPGDYYSVLKSIFDCCIRCSFQPTSFINRIRELFSSNERTTEILRRIS